MDLRTKLDIELKEALRTKNEVRKQTIRMILSSIKNSEIDKQIKLDDIGIISILQKELKIRQEAIEETKKAHREDLLQANLEEISVIKSFLPDSLSEEDLLVIIQDVIKENNLSSPSDMGKAIKLIMQRVAGRATGDQVSKQVKNILVK